ncbi:MAG: type II toxin-antitoxin system RelE/ParE family toxin [Ferruginibacter sp.]
MIYKLQIEKAALKYIKKQDVPTIKRLMAAIDQIAENPHIGEPLINHAAQYKYRVGSYRILYKIVESELVISIIKVGPRGDVYN